MPPVKNLKTYSLKNIFKSYGLNIGVIVTIIVLASSGLIYIGRLDERVINSHERMDRLVEQMNTLNKRLDQQIDAIEAAKKQAVAEIRSLTTRSDDPVIFTDGRLTSGYDMGVNTSGGLTNWANANNGHICMSYPPGQSWGSVFITVGKPTQHSRAARDFSRYQMLSLELRGINGGESVTVGLKDNTDPDDGSESKILIQNLTTNWNTFEIPLSRFRTADLSRLYIVTEFVFENSPQTVCFRKIEFLP